jgi:prevent-host-death family protein
MKRIGIFKAKTRLSELCREVNEKQAPYVIEKRGRAIALLSPVPEELRTAQPDIVQALADWEAAHGKDSTKQDFPEVWKERSLPKNHPELD